MPQLYIHTYSVDVMNMQSLMDKMNIMSNFNIENHYQMAIDSYFCIVWYGEDVDIMGLQYS